jgi:signal transduction histidine kinase
VRVAAWFTAALGVALLGATIALSPFAGKAGDDGSATGWLFAPAYLTMIAVGLLIAHRRPTNRIAWVLLLGAVALGTVFLGQPWAGYALDTHPGSLPAGRLAGAWSEVGWPMLYVTPAAIAFLFPDGRLLSPRWRPVAIASAATFVLAPLAMITWPTNMDPPLERYRSPLAFEGIPNGFRVAAIVSLIFPLAASARVVYVRFKRSEGIERLQLKWLAWSASLIPAALLVCWIEGFILDGSGIATGIAVALMLMAIPVSVGFAVTRHHLYEIDRLINRTLVYVTLTVLLGLAFIGVTLVVGIAVGRGSPIATAAATLAVAVSFNPGRRRVQVWVDRRFSRARYDALRRIGTYLEAVRDGHAPPEATGRVLADALRDPSLELRYWLPASNLYVDADGRLTGDDPDDGRARTEVTRGGARLGVVLHDQRLSEQRDLLNSAVAAAGLAIEIARLRVEVNRQLAQVEESRARIVTAGYEERRRLERDLHDGAQQGLVSIGLALRHVQHELGDEHDAALRSQLDDTVAQVAAAIDDLRRIARGVRPPRLDEGLMQALRDLAARSPFQVELDLDPAGLDGLDPDIEAAAWYVASEALANAAKHSSASRVRLAARRVGDNLRVAVEDDGTGGARRDGGGLAGLSDRVAAHGGSFHMHSPAGSGTTVVAQLPCV